MNEPKFITVACDGCGEPVRVRWASQKVYDHTKCDKCNPPLPMPSHVARGYKLVSVEEYEKNKNEH